MPISKENYKLESRLVDIQNMLREQGAKLDALMKNNMKEADYKAVKLPPREKAIDGPTSMPYALKHTAEEDEKMSTIRPPVVLPEGQTVPQAVEEAMEKRAMDTIPAPKTPVEGEEEVPSIPEEPVSKPVATPRVSA